MNQWKLTLLLLRLFQIGVLQKIIFHLRPIRKYYSPYWCLIIGEAHVIQTRDQKNNFLKKI